MSYRHTMRSPMDKAVAFGRREYLRRQEADLRRELRERGHDEYTARELERLQQLRRWWEAKT